MLVGKKTSFALCTPNFLTHTLGPTFRITVLAAGRNMGATPPRVERVICPFNGRILCHQRDFVCLRIVAANFIFSQSKQVFEPAIAHFLRNLRNLWIKPPPPGEDGIFVAGVR